MDLFVFSFAQLPLSTGHNRQVAHALYRRFTRKNQKSLKELFSLFVRKSRSVFERDCKGSTYFLIDKFFSIFFKKSFFFPTSYRLQALQERLKQAPGYLQYHIR